MPELEAIQAITAIAGNITVPAVLIWWIITERKRGELLLQVVLTDWQRQREEEIERRAEEKYQRKLSTIPVSKSPNG